MPIWNPASARHLLARTLFGYTRTDLANALTYASAADFVSRQLLADLPQPAPPNTWVTEVPVANNGAVDGQRYAELTLWWYNRMLTEPTTMRERMVLFWHNHFTSDRAKVNYPQHMYQQNALFRKQAFGNFRQFVKDVTIDPAMLIYLDGRQNNKNAPNENYGRELMELFTLGIGNYTDTDVKQVALCMTGWRVDGLGSTFVKTNFADSAKTVLGKTGNFSYADAVDVILSQDAAAEFISRKLYKEFVYQKPNDAFVKQMADVFRKANYEIRPLLQFLFTADEFYKLAYRGAKIKSPTEFAIGTLKYLGLANPDLQYVADTGKALTQQLFYPPNVQGWVGYHEWINSNTYPTRGGFSDALINGKKPNGQKISVSLNPLDYVRSFKSSEDARQLVSDVTELMVQFPLSDTKKAFLLDTLLDGTVLSNWSTNTPMADARVQKFMRAVMRLPEYQLC